MSHGYSIYFTTKEGKFMGCWAIQHHFRKYDILELKHDRSDAFIGDFYELKDTYDAIEINIQCELWDFLGHYNTFEIEEIIEGIIYSRKNKLRMFLG
jgi:hypothetical protein